MIYICNFYAHKREGVSNQIELLRAHTDGYLFSAGIFLDQQYLLHKDISQKRIILSESEFKHALPDFVKSLPKNEKIHYFSEEQEADKLKIFNSVPNNLYISMYRKPTKKYAFFLKKFKNLSRIYVELESHKKILIKCGIKPGKIIISNSPSMFKRSFGVRNFTNKFLFASWNGGSIKSLTERGLMAILDFLEANRKSVCNILLRDNETSLYKKIIKKRGLDNRITLSNIDSIVDLHNAFLETDIVLFLMQKKLTKDVPNSIIDGFSLGKPVIMTNTVDFAKDVVDYNMGWVIKPNEILEIKKIKETYKEKSQNAFKYSKKMTSANYIKDVISGY
jgi:glycosyltransferase involved in cell wall biosynthesis